jgi:predicted PurR-regulated permease PerM
MQGGKVERSRWPYATKLTVSLLLLAFLIYLLSRFHQIIIPIVIAIIVAYILNPIVGSFQGRLHIPRVLAILITYLIILAFIIGIPILVFTILGENIEPLQIDPQRIITTLENTLAQTYTVAGVTIHPSAFAGQVLTALQGLLQPVVGQTVNILKSVITSVIWIILITLVSIYLIKDSSKLEDWFASHLPQTFLPDYQWMRNEINQIWNAFFRGQILLAAIVTAVFIAIGFILGLPFALAMGFLAGILEFLPSIGHGIWLLTASLLALFIGSSWIPIPNWAFMLIVIGLHLIFEQVDMNYLIPRVVGRRVQLPALVVILGIAAGAILAGVIGIPLAAPTIASMRVIGRYIFANLFDMEWKPVSATQPLPPPKTYWWQRTRKREKVS